MNQEMIKVLSNIQRDKKQGEQEKKQRINMFQLRCINRHKKTDELRDQECFSLKFKGKL